MQWGEPVPAIDADLLIEGQTVPAIPRADLVMGICPCVVELTSYTQKLTESVMVFHPAEKSFVLQWSLPLS